MNDKQFERVLNSAGKWFFLVQYEEIVDFDGDKSDLVDHIFTNRNDNLDGGKFDSEIGGTQTRISSILRIIKNKKDKDALKIIRDSKMVNSQHPDAYKLASSILTKRFK